MPGIDFSEVKDLEPLPNGQYNCEIVYAQEGTSQNGNPKIDLRWKVLDDEFAGRLIFDTLTFTANALFRVKQALKAVGFPENFSGEVVPADLIGLQATLRVGLDKGSTNADTGEEYPARNRVMKYQLLTANTGSLLG
jgi:hypothetical protein